MQQRLAPAVGALPDTHLIRGPLLEPAFYSINDWQAFVSAVQHAHGHGTAPPFAARFIRANSRQVRPAQAPRVRRPAFQRRCRSDDRRLRARAAARARESHGQPLPRDNLIKLLTAAQRGLADELAWAVRLRKFLEGHGGRMPLHQQPHNDRSGHPSLHL